MGGIIRSHPIAAKNKIAAIRVGHPSLGVLPANRQFVISAAIRLTTSCFGALDGLGKKSKKADLVDHLIPQGLKPGLGE